MIGSIIGDIAGSCYEFRGIKTKDIELFPQNAEITDDSILSIATAEVLLKGGSYMRKYQQFGRLYPDPMGGYGEGFRRWIEQKDPLPYNSWGNGAAMRVGPIGLAKKTLEDVMSEAELSANVSHNHPEGVKGAQATAMAVFLARTGHDKNEIRARITETFGYDLSRSVDEIRPDYSFDESCQGTVPEAITAFLDSRDFEDAIRLAISLGGDADTLACITGGIAEAYYKSIPSAMVELAFSKLPSGLRPTVESFLNKFPLLDASVGPR